VLGRNTAEWTYLHLEGRAPANAAKVRFGFFIYAEEYDAADVKGSKVYVDGAVVTMK
jgi:hypothetical protein